MATKVSAHSVRSVRRSGAGADDLRHRQPLHRCQGRRLRRCLSGRLYLHRRSNAVHPAGRVHRLRRVPVGLSGGGHFRGPRAAAQRNAIRRDQCRVLRAGGDRLGRSGWGGASLHHHAGPSARSQAMSVAISALVLRDAGFAQGTVLVEGNRIAAVGLSSIDRAALREQAAEHVDAGNCWLIPGLIDAHAHGYATLLRGTENSMPLELWALYTVLYGRAYDAAAMRAAILLGAAERIRAGITGWVDHSPMVHLAEAALTAHAESGLRVCWAAFLHDISDYALMDLKLPPEVALLGGSTPPFDSDAYSQWFGEFVQTAKPDRVAVMLGPNAPQRCSPEAWALWRNLRDRYGVAVHTHLMETRAQEAVGARWPGGLVAEMERQGLLDDRLSVAHGIWLTRRERATLARHGVTLTHNPASNLMLGSGVLPLMDSRAAGLAVAIG